MQHKQKQLVAMGQNYANLTPQQQMQYNNIMRGPQMQQNQPRPGPNAVPPQQQPQAQQQQQQQQPALATPQKAPQANMSQNKGGAAAQTPGGPKKGGQKNLKRTNTSDDVVEISDPKGTKGPAKNTAQPSHTTNNISQANRQQANATSGQQKAEQASQQRQQASQNNTGPQSQPPQPPQQQARDQQRVQLRLRELAQQVQRSMPPRQAKPMDPQTRMGMIKMLGESRKMLTQSEAGVTLFLQLFGDEEKTKNLLRMVSVTWQFLWRIILMHNSGSCCLSKLKTVISPQSTTSQFPLRS